MISATILDILNDGPKVSIHYVLLDDNDPMYSKEGDLNVPIGSTTSDINAQLTPIVDAANYASSLRPLINGRMDSPNSVPVQVEPLLKSRPIAIDVASTKKEII